MPLVQVPKNVQPRQFEFGEGVERSKPGALYFSPGTLKKITNDELEAIRKEDKRYASLLVIISNEDKKSRLQIEREKEEAAAPKANKLPKERMSVSKQRQQAILGNKGKFRGTSKNSMNISNSNPNKSDARLSVDNTAELSDNDNSKNKKKQK